MTWWRFGSRRATPGRPFSPRSPPERSPLTLSPIDLIPDFVPVLGYLDDLLVVPLGIMLAVRLVPPPLMAEFRAKAARRKGKRVNCAGFAIVAIWLIAIGAAAWFLRPHLIGA